MRWLDATHSYQERFLIYSEMIVVPPVLFPVPMTRLLQDSHGFHKVKHSPFVLFEERLESLNHKLRVEQFGVSVQLEPKPHGGFVPFGAFAVRNTAGCCVARVSRLILRLRVLVVWHRLGC